MSQVSTEKIAPAQILTMIKHLKQKSVSKKGESGAELLLDPVGSFLMRAYNKSLIQEIQ